MTQTASTEFDYLLNAVERAAQAPYPAAADYAGKRLALLKHVRELERKAAAAPDLLEALRMAVRQNEHDMLMTGEELRAAQAAITKATGSAA